ncbi:proline iminopeptidase-family hydrolase [Bacillus sp. FJAT-27245]|uniref:proline iminopeptidase-family hydrolase n=1 Tax=Bacillus sp. FJAT-27245 TaxID=1684144 RepID=UPI0006A78EF9|nr:proline iminopeptidase-family hydrolase [Bacillus sp. FJAT-27245]
MNIKEGFVDVTGGKVWYRWVNGAANAVPLLVLHGGPGSSYYALQRLDKLAEDTGRTVVYYDQLGAGRSKGPTDKALWNLDRYVEELGQVREQLGLKEVHILGHSWGTTLLAAYLLTKPDGVKSAIFSSPCLDAPRWAKDQERLLKELPEETQAVIARCEADGTTDSEEYQQAMRVFAKNFVCRIEISPEEREMTSQLANLEVYNTMWGPSEFCVTGNLKEFDCTPRLHDLSVPSLFLCGRFDEATPESTSYFSSRVPGAKLHIFEKSAHSPYREQPEEYRETVAAFLDEAEFAST